MSLAPQNTPADITDALNGSLTEWYSNVDNCLKTSECVPGHYEYTQAPSYGTQCPIQEGGSTKIDIGCSRFEIIEIDNSYIDCTIKYPLQFPPQLYQNEQYPNAGTGRLYYVGFKSAFDVIDQYRIYSNGDLVQTQNNACYDSFINYITLTDSAKETSPAYATLDKVLRRDQNVPGVYVLLDNVGDISFDIDIHMKIPLNAFPLLQHLRYYPGFMGKLSIEIYPSYKNLVWVNITEDDEVIRQGFSAFDIKHKQIGMGPQPQNAAPHAYTTEQQFRCGAIFRQINTIGYNRLYIDTADNNTAKCDDYQISCNYSTLTEFKLYQAVYMVKMDVYNALEMNYLQIPLLFPIQTVTNVKFTYAMGNDSHFTLQNTATLSHCDAIFVVFPENSNERTVSFNPEIKAQLSINGKYYPREPLTTNGTDPRFINLVHDALNINNNPLMTPGKDIETSLKPYTHTFKVIEANFIGYDVYYFAAGDRSNFVYAVPLSTDEDFMVVSHQTAQQFK